MPTRLLDWTTNAIAALYFAVSKKPDLAKDGRVFAMDAYQLCQVQGAPGEYEGIATSRRPLFKRMLTPIFDWKNELVPGFTLAVRPDHSDVRIRLQRGCFTFHVPGREALTEYPNVLVSFIVPAARKGPIMEELRVLGIDEFSIYGDLEALARTLKDAY